MPRSEPRPGSNSSEAYAHGFLGVPCSVLAAARQQHQPLDSGVRGCFGEICDQPRCPRECQVGAVSEVSGPDPSRAGDQVVESCQSKGNGARREPILTATSRAIRRRTSRAPVRPVPR